MSGKVVDLVAFRIEKSLRDSGFILKRDEKNNVLILIKVNSNDNCEQ